MKFGRKVLQGVLTVFVAGLVPILLWAQSQGPFSSDSRADQAIRVRVDLVNVLITVTDDKNRFVTDLLQNHFQVLEDGKPQQIVNFSRDNNLPLSIALLIDTSTSIAPKLEFEQQAASNFFFSVLRPQDRALLMEFDARPELLQDFTNNPNDLAEQTKKLRAGGGTALYDALFDVAEQKLLNESGRKTAIIISDGVDTSSKNIFQQALEMAHRAEVTVYCISTNRGGLFGVGGNREGDRALQQMAEETGGRLFFPFKKDDLEMAFQEINRELRSQYYVGYISSNGRKDGSYRTIQVKLEGRKGLNVRHRKGYFAPSS